MGTIRWLKNHLKHLPVAAIANLFYRFPAKKINLIGVTGTDGKTTTANLIFYFLNSLGKKTSLISTLSAKINQEVISLPAHVTTPNSFFIQKMLRMMVNGGNEWAVVEATSHGLDQNRLWGTGFKIGVFTNLSHEHLDYHQNMDRYLKAKLKLFGKSQIVVLNKDDPCFKDIKKSLIGKGKRIVTYGIDNPADFRAEEIKMSLKATSFYLKFRRQKIKITSPLVGRFNVYNLLAALAAAAVVKTDLAKLSAAARSITPPNGRMNPVKNKKGIKAIIDFAHTPNSLKNCLQTIRSVSPKSKIIVLFGCAGLRDKDKRPLMGQAAGKYADVAVLTSEDPRLEKPAGIIAQIAKGCRQSGMKKIAQKKAGEVKNGQLNKVFFTISDRQAAINFAIRKLANRDDVVVFCGKGHESSICFGKTEYPWSEYQAVKTALREK